jgi:hypothetical protein
MPKEVVQQYVEPAIDWEKPGFDHAALAKKYAQEREKRLRTDGNEQYKNASDFGEFLKDPWAVPFERPAITEDVDIVIVGGGIAAVQTAVRLHEAGIKGKQVRMIEKAGDFGGTERIPGELSETASLRLTLHRAADLAVVLEPLPRSSV